MTKKLSEKQKLKLMREVSDTADELAKVYVENLRKTTNDGDGEQKSITPHEMDRVLRIGKQYSERLLLAEGKNTSNIGIDGKGGLPFKFVINKHYPEGSGEEVTSDKCEGEAADFADDAD